MTRVGPSLRRWLLGWLALAVMLAGHGAVAGPAANVLQLRDGQETYDLGSYLHVTRDPAQTLSYPAMAARYDSGNWGEMVTGRILPLGATMVPHWVVFSVNNQSWNERWVLSFGDYLHGRVGLIQQIFLYDAQTGQKYLDNITPTQNPYIGQQGRGTPNVALNLQRGRQSLLFLYVVPDAGMAATLAPQLLTEQKFNQSLNRSLAPGQLLNIFFSIMIGFFLASIFVEKSWIDLLFVLYYGVQMAMFNFGNAMLFTAMPHAGDVTGLLFGGGAIIALILSKFYLEIGPLHRLQNRLFLGFGVAILGGALLAYLITPSFLAHTLLAWFPGLLAIFYLFILSLAQALSGERTYLFAAGWLAVSAGALTMLLAVANVITPTAALIGGYWWGMVAQGIIFSIAVTLATLAGGAGALCAFRCRARGRGTRRAVARSEGRG